MSKQMEYLVILFSPPGPGNTDAEIEKVVAILKQQEDVTPQAGCKVKTMVKDVGEVSKLDFIKAAMTHTLRIDTANPFVYEVLTTGYYAQEYAFFQACYAVVKTSTQDLAKAAHNLDQLNQMKSVLTEIVAGRKPLQQPRKRWWQFWK
ncbi:MAG: hypothetical protein ACREEM_08665 [Blastocatellia bacterium]